MASSPTQKTVEDSDGVDTSIAWLAAAPAAAVTLFAAVLLGPPLGRLLFPIDRSGFWPSALPYVLPEPTEDARFLLFLLGAVLVPVGILWFRRHRGPLRPVPRGVVVAQQLAFVAVLALAVFCRLGSVHLGHGYFDPMTIVVALAVGAGLALILTHPALRSRLRPLVEHRSRGARWAAIAIAALATVIWLLPSIQLDTTISHAQPGTAFDLEFTFEEGLTVVNGHSPLVDYVTQYGSLWPYLIAIPLNLGHDSLGAFTTLMAFVTLVAMLAVYAVIRRVVGSPFVALLMFLPFLATSFFIMRGNPIQRYSFADYLGVFPLRYAGPYFVLFLLARYFRGEWPRRVVWIFLVAGLAVIDNTDFGLACLGATAVAVVAAAGEPRTRRWWGERIGEAVSGLLGAFVLVSIVTVARTGELPDLGLAFRYAHLFGVAGYELLPMPWFGFWVAVYLTFCTALVVAALLITHRTGRRIEIGTLAWVGIFGLGSGAYYAGRSHYEVLVALFSSWGLAVLLLLAVTTKDLLKRGGRPSPAQLALFVGFGLMVCSLAQFPAPWRSIHRLRTIGPEVFQPTEDIDFVAGNTEPGEPVVLITNLGQRISRAAGVDDVMQYSGIPSIPTRIQLTESLERLRQEGGTKVFLHQEPYSWPELLPALEAHGFHQVTTTEVVPEPGAPPEPLLLLSNAEPESG